MDFSTLTFEQRLDLIKSVQNDKKSLENKVSDASCKYADGTSPDWAKLLDKYDSIIEACREAQKNEWSSSISDQAASDVNSTEDVDARTLAFSGGQSDGHLWR